jgi:hypothetical protein
VSTLKTAHMSSMRFQGRCERCLRLSIQKPHIMDDLSEERPRFIRLVSKIGNPDFNVSDAKRLPAPPTVSGVELTQLASGTCNDIADW